MKTSLSLAAAQENVFGRVNDLLDQEFGKKLWKASDTDKLRMLRLEVWETRHNVSLRYILKTLVPHFERMSLKWRKKKTNGLGFGFALLAGDLAEEILKEAIKKDFPNGENVEAEISRNKQKAEAAFEDQTNTREPRSVLEYRKVSDFVTAVVERTSRKREEIERVAAMVAKQPFRGNPFAG